MDLFLDGLLAGPLSGTCTITTLCFPSDSAFLGLASHSQMIHIGHCEWAFGLLILNMVTVVLNISNVCLILP